MKPHIEHKIDCIEYYKNKTIKMLEKKGFTITRIEVL